MSEAEMEELARRCNEFMRYFSSLPEDVKDKYVREVIRYIVKMYQDIASAMPNILKAKKVFDAYKAEIEKRKHEIIVVLTYVIKEKYQSEIAPLFYSLLGLL